MKEEALRLTLPQEKKEIFDQILRDWVANGCARSINNPPLVFAEDPDAIQRGELSALELLHMETWYSRTKGFPKSPVYEVVGFDIFNHVVTLVPFSTWVAMREVDAQVAASPALLPEQPPRDQDRIAAGFEKILGRATSPRHD